MNTLAMWLIEAGDFAAAEPLVRGALEMRKKLLGPEHADVAGSMTLLAGLLVETGRYEEALDAGHGRKGHLAQGVDALTPGVRPAPTAAEGAALAGLRQFDEAEKLLLASYKVLHEDRGAVHVLRDEFESVARKALPGDGAARKGAQVQAARLTAAERSSGAGSGTGASDSA